MSGQETLRTLFGLEGKVAVVTGGASGIGKRVAQVLSDAGAAVVVADRDIRGAKKVADELGSNCVAMGFDLADDQSIIDLFSQVAETHDRLDILINNAGIYPKYSLDSLTEEQWQSMQKINTWGCFVALREAAKLMKRSSSNGRIVNISSVGAARTAVNNQIAYNASKAALDSITQSSALDLAEFGICVNSILPGAVRPLDLKAKPLGHSPPAGPLMGEGRILLGRPALAEEIAGPVLMLVSPAGAYITGQAIVIDGGFSIS